MPNETFVVGLDLGRADSQSVVRASDGTYIVDGRPNSGSIAVRMDEHGRMVVVSGNESIPIGTVMTTGPAGGASMTAGALVSVVDPAGWQPMITKEEVAAMMKNGEQNDELYKSLAQWNQDDLRTDNGAETDEEVLAAAKGILASKRKEEERKRLAEHMRVRRTVMVEEEDDDAVLVESGEIRTMERSRTAILRKYLEGLTDDQLHAVMHVLKLLGIGLEEEG